MRKAKYIFAIVIFIMGLLIPFCETLADTGQYAEKLSQIGITEMKSRTDPNHEVSRIESIVLIVRLMGKETEAQKLMGKSIFTDVPEWGTGYANFAYENDITKGIGDGKLGSNDNITENEYFTFLLRVLGYGSEDFEQSAAVDYARSIGLIEDINEFSPFLREQLYKASYLALSQKCKNSNATLTDKLIKSSAVNVSDAVSVDIVDNNSVVSFEDIQLEKVIRSKINKAEGDILRSDVLPIKSLTYEEFKEYTTDKIVSLDGMQYLENLTFLNITGNYISDLTPVSNLKKLRKLYVSQNCIRDVSPIAKLNLTHVYLISNLITDVSALKDMQSSLIINVTDNPIADITPIEHLRQPAKALPLETCVELSNAVDRIINDVITPGMNDFEKEKALHDYVVANAEYTKSKNTDNPEVVDTIYAYGILVKGRGVCGGFSYAMRLLLDAVGIETYYITGTHKGINHAWNKVKIGGNFYCLDATENNRKNDSLDNIRYTYFNLTDEALSETHIPKNGLMFPATATEYNYFVYNDLVASDYGEFKSIVTAAYTPETKIIQVYVKNYSKDSYKLGFVSKLTNVSWKSGYSRKGANEGVFSLYFDTDKIVKKSMTQRLLEMFGKLQQVVASKKTAVFVHL